MRRSRAGAAPQAEGRGLSLFSCAAKALPWLLASAVLVAMAPAGTAGQTPEGFDHDEHAGLFPLCTGCHQGIERGVPAQAFPERALCARCHDGVNEVTVSWTPPTPRSELRYEHTEHARRIAESGDSLTCLGCHEEPDAPRMVGVFRAAQDRCASCHVHATTDHYVAGACETCHVPLARSGWDAVRIAGLALPSDHEPADPFLASGHGPEAEETLERCATCHVQDQCAACHVNASAVEAIQAIPAAADLEVPPIQARYPVPATHETAAFLEDHPTIEMGAECSTCHTRDDCASCHYDVDGRGFQATFVASEVVAPGVGVVSHAPASHASPYFAVDHAAMAASDQNLCATCHTRPFCTACHDDPGPTSFHAPDYALQHAADAYGQTMECANCHSTAVFCLACHAESGLGSDGRLTAGYHDAEPAWLLRHGQAARQSLETCASCHEQRECMQCHAQGGAFGVSPHGPDFDARRAQERNPAICFACHLSDPLNPGR